MSATVHYFGKIKSQDSIRELQEEFREIAQVSGWSFELVDHSYAQDGTIPTRLTLKGIRITLSKTASSLQLTFDRDGYLSYIFYEKNTPEDVQRASSPSGRSLLHQIHTSTTLCTADPRLHVTLVKLLDYLKKRYVPNLEVIDNTGYWYSRDEAVLSPKRLELVKK